MIDHEIKPLEHCQKDGVCAKSRRSSLLSEASTALNDSFSSFKLLDIKELLGGSNGSKPSLKMDEEAEENEDHQDSANSLRFPSLFSNSGSNLNAKLGLGGSSHHSRGSKSNKASKLFNINRLFQSENMLGVELEDDGIGKGSNHSKNGMLFNRIFKSESSLKAEKDDEDKAEGQEQDDDNESESDAEGKEDALEIAEQNETIRKIQRKQRPSRSPPRRTKSTSEDKPTRRKRPSDKKRTSRSPPRRTKSSAGDGEKGPALHRAHTHTGVKVSPHRRTKSSADDDEKHSKRPALRRTNSSVEDRFSRSSRIKSRACDHNDKNGPPLRRTSSGVELRAKSRTSRSPLRRTNSTFEDRPTRSPKRSSRSSANIRLGASLSDLNYVDGVSKSRVGVGRGASLSPCRPTRSTKKFSRSFTNNPLGTSLGDLKYYDGDSKRKDGEGSGESLSPRRSKPEIAKKLRNSSSTDDTAGLLKSSSSSREMGTHRKNCRKARSPPRSSCRNPTRLSPRRTKSCFGDRSSPRRTKSFDAPLPSHKAARSPVLSSPRRRLSSEDGHTTRKKEYEDVLSIWGIEESS